MATEGQEHQALFNFLSKLGLEKFYPNKLTLQSLLEVNKHSISGAAAESVDQLPWHFLRKLFQINAECRNCTQLSNDDDSDEENNDLFDLDFYTEDGSAGNNKVNPLDLTAALFLCADSFLQQEIALKMSMCQFSVPLLLPHGSNSQSTLMLWALRDIIKEWRPHDLPESRGFVEKSIVQANMPFFSFVRLKNCSLSKSQFLNNILSPGQCSHNFFIHRDMKGGTVTKTIASGLVEVCWFLPSGTESLDIFPAPIAFASMRGDICESLAQFNFLFYVSTATFVFLDKAEEDEQKILASLQDVNSKLVLVVNCKEGGAREDLMSVKTLVKQLNLPNSSVKTRDPRANVAGFSEKLRRSIKKLMTNRTNTVTIEDMFDKAVELGLSVDENKCYNQKKAAEEIVKGIGVRSIPEYKKQQLPLQGENWKSLSQLEMEECRLKKCTVMRPEEYKSQLKADKEKLSNDQRIHQLSKAMKCFIENVSERDKEKRDFFLKWMKLKLNAHLQSSIQLSLMRDKLKEQCSKKEKDLKVIADLDRALLECSLGIEHYMREMGLIYDFSITSSAKAAVEVSGLPGIAADLLLDGYPLELLDGDASNIPERWVTDVLLELHEKVGRKSRLLVLTVLGVQSTGKSTLLNTMFGVQFPVSSGRCTRGVYMLFLKVGQDMQSDVNCDFIVLIDTEGLKSPVLAQLEDSYEHDNQLATFVIGLSDVTLINIAMENSTEMKDVLQIATHAFLRMKEIGKRPVCHFVHQNVAGVSAHSKTMTERKHLLDQLNEMTLIAAEMEKRPSIKAFTDVLDYDMEKNNWNIPGLWQGTPPMAPVNTGYSEAVADIKKNLLETVKRDMDNEASHIPEFLEWIRSLWKAVKYENFIFSFRNTLVANAYDNLCIEFGQWEWDFKKEILNWQQAAVLEIKNAELEQDLNELVCSMKSEASNEIADQEKIMKQKLQDYYKTKKDIHVNLIEKYKMDFFNSISFFANEMKYSVHNALDRALEWGKSLKQAQDIQRKPRQMIEEQVMTLLSESKESTLSDTQLKDEFEKIWTKATMNIAGLEEQNIYEILMRQLKRSFFNRNINEELQNIGDLKEMGEGTFKARKEHIKKGKKILFHKTKDIKRQLQTAADVVIASSERFVLDVVATNQDYHESFTKDLLDRINKALDPCYKNCNKDFEIDLKLHICGFALKKFVIMHQNFLAANDPQIQLEQFKTQYLADFLDLYKEKDHCQRKATDFIQRCIKPAVEEYVSRSLGTEIVDEVLTSDHSAEYSSRSFFQYNIQKELLQQDNFENFVRYIQNYEIYVKDWIFRQIQEKMSENKTLCTMKNRNLQVIVHKIGEAIEQASKGKDGTLLPDNRESITDLINSMRKYLIKDISLSVEAEKSTLFQIQSTCHPFIKSLKLSIDELKKQMQEEFLNSGNITEILKELPVRPQDELFKKVFGCGHQCPFCKVPCEAAGKEHKLHCASVHRPQGLGSYRFQKTQTLVETLCTTLVISETKFRNTDTKLEYHPYKDYATYYPDWHIPPDSSIEASDYWKYILVRYNDRFAEKYKAKPADIPKVWKSITKEQALKGLKDAYNMK